MYNARAVGAGRRLPRNGAAVPPGRDRARRTQRRRRCALELSDRVRKRGALRVRRDSGRTCSIRPPSAPIRYYSNHPSYNALPDWLARRSTRDRAQRAVPRARRSIARWSSRLTKPAPIDELGLFERDARRRDQAGGGSRHGARRSAFRSAMLMLMYITVMSSAPQLLNSVIEEKMSRISEVLIGSVTPFELMMGKLLGSAAVSVLLAGDLHGRRPRRRAVLGRLRERGHAGDRSAGSCCS